MATFNIQLLKVHQLAIPPGFNLTFNLQPSKSKIN